MPLEIEVLQPASLPAEREAPDPAWVRGTCPYCGQPVVSNTYWTGRGYVIRWECWASLGEQPTCEFRRVL